MNNKDIAMLKEVILDMEEAQKRSESYLAEQESYLKEAKADIECFNLLYPSQIARSIYSLQQAVEKLTKSFMLMLGSLTPKQLSGTHKAHMTIVDMLKEKKFEKIVYLLDYKPDYNEKDFVDSIKKIPYPKIAIMTAEELKKGIDESRHIEENNESFFLQIKAKMKEGQTLGKISQLIKKQPKIDDELIKRYIEGISIFMRLFILSIITCPHVESTRYATNNKGIDLKPEDYKAGLGIVDMAQIIAKEASDIILKLEIDLKDRQTEDKSIK